MRSISLALALGLVLAASPVFAQTTPCPPSSGQPQAAQQQAGPQAMDVAVVEGHVTSVAADLQLFRLRDLGGKSAAIHVTPQTRIFFPDGKIAAFSDLREGQRVQASFRVNQAGQAVADQVNILSEGAAQPGGQRQRGAVGGQGGGWKSERAS